MLQPYEIQQPLTMLLFIQSSATGSTLNHSLCGDSLCTELTVYNNPFHVLSCTLKLTIFCIYFLKQKPQKH